MIKLLSPRDETELMMLKSLLECNGIAFHVQNEFFGGLYPGLNVFSFSERVILVAESDLARATLLAGDFLEAMSDTHERKGQAG